MPPHRQTIPSRFSITCRSGFFGSRKGLEAPSDTRFRQAIAKSWHAAQPAPVPWFDSKQRVIRLEAERGSTRSRTWFDSKQNVIRLEAEPGSTRITLPHTARHATARQRQWHHKAANKLQQRPPDHCFNGFAFPEGDILLTGHGWRKCRPKGDMKCLPCLRPRRMDELYRSSTVFRKTAHSSRWPLSGKSFNSHGVGHTGDIHAETG